jgi:flagellar biosynthesis/type III secretory pathway M-ring protein FliF/YscJ
VVALIVGIVFVLFAVYSVLPLPGWGLNWWQDVLQFLRGGVPLVAVLVGIIAVFIGIADIKDRIEAKREEAEEAAAKETEKPKA